MDTVLMLVDIQNDYFSRWLYGASSKRGGRKESRSSSPGIQGKIPAGGSCTACIQSSRGDFFLPEQGRAEIHDRVRPLREEKVFVKHFPNSFRETGLEDHIRGLVPERLVIAGMMTHMCIDNTVRARADFGFKCILAGDACDKRSSAEEPVPAKWFVRRFSRRLTVPSPW